VSISTILKKSGQVVLDFVFPPRCVSCETENAWLCQNCLNQISYILGPICQQCGLPLPNEKVSICQSCDNKVLIAIDGIRAAAYFENTPIRQAIHSLKYYNHRAIVSILGQILAKTYHRYGLGADVLVPVPLHPLRWQERGYNQSELLAQALGNLVNVPVETQTLQRIRHTEAQTKLGAEARQKNVADAFACQLPKLARQNILLIDDVCTTGSTLDACAIALKQSGVRAVWGLTLARALT
jgi:ComF family protein